MGARKRCKHCGGWLEAKMIQAARLTWGDASTDVFAKTLPVLICPKCDSGDPKHGITVPRKRG